jgi:regulator of sigma E protease
MSLPPQVLTILAFLFVLGVLVFVHELGHFLAARRVGVRVITFSLGFGPKILKFTRGDTEYCVSIVPLGGYVKMAGENPDDPGRSGQPDEFLSKTKWQRFQILIMGPLMNIALAVIVLALVLAQGAHVAAYKDEAPVIGVVVHGSPAERAGVMAGDRILSVGSDKVETWEDLLMRVAMKPNRDVELSLLRGGQTISIAVRPAAEGRFEVGTLGVMPANTHPIIDSVIAGGPADKAGLKAKDEIVAINDEPMVFRQQLIAEISKHGGQTVDLIVKRGDGTLRVRATPKKSGARGMLDMYLTDRVKSFMPGPVEAFKLSVQENIESSGLIFRTLTGLFTGETSVRQLQGPVGIAQLSGESAAEGWVSLFQLMAMLSINLGILNLMPVPVLDGGHILILMLEGIARRDFSMRVKEKMLLAGFVVLMMLMVTVIYNDLTRISWLERLMPWRN